MQIFLTAGLLIQKKTGMMALALSFSAVLNIVLNCLLLPKMGLQAAALATLVSYVVCTVLLSYFAFRVLPLRIELSAVLGYVVASGAALAAGSITELGVPIWNLLVKPTIAVAVYCGVLYLVDRRLRVVTTQLWRKLRQKAEVQSVLVA
jgi:O-antigen/teichoic acid export membrane protein